jgi:molecular chaperone GrpE
MAEPTTTAPAAGTEPTGQRPEVGAESAAGQDGKPLQERLKAAEQQRDDYFSLLQRTQADFENFQKRIRRDLADEQRYAIADFARELLAVQDNLRRALSSVRNGSEKNPLVEGLALVQSQLLDTLARFGITPIDAQGQQFDPSVHEVVLQRPRDDVAPNTVVDVLEPGYRLHGRVLRPAKVVLAGPEKTS